MMNKILLCSDLDRTLLPNGPQPESRQARHYLTTLAQHSDIALAYVSGRHLTLVEQAITEFSIPVPNYVIADVGTSIYSRQDNRWELWSDWHAALAPDWCGMQQQALSALLQDWPDIVLQEAEKQNTYKLSYYTQQDIDTDHLLLQLKLFFETRKIQANLIWSIDEMTQQGLLDILPASANKLHAIKFLIQKGGFNLQHCLFAGDSGNDLDVLVSEIPAVLVRNAMGEVQQQALRQVS